MAPPVPQLKRSFQWQASVVNPPEQRVSPRQSELLELAYQYVLTRGLSDLSLRPLASAIGSSPRVLLFLFGSKEGLVRALLGRARTDELALVAHVRAETSHGDLVGAVRVTWEWLSDEAHRPLLALWLQAYAQSLVEPHGPWSDFARQTVVDWLGILAGVQDGRRRRSRSAIAERTLALAVLRGALLDLLATGDVTRTSAAVEHHLLAMSARGSSRGAER
jgi:AcrR family transcriptional regulator